MINNWFCLPDYERNHSADGISIGNVWAICANGWETGIRVAETVFHFRDQRLLGALSSLGDGALEHLTIALSLSQSPKVLSPMRITGPLVSLPIFTQSFVSLLTTVTLRLYKPLSCRKFSEKVRRM
jgi:hypothetical protein